MAGLPGHPTDDSLDAFVLGTLSDSEFSVIDNHLTECIACESRAASRTPNDPLIALLASAGKSRSSTAASASSMQVETSRFQETASPAGHDSGRLESGGPGLALSDPIPTGLIQHPRYQIIRQLGRGGMGTVWLAQHVVMGRFVALKAIRPELLIKPDAVARFRREIQAAARLNHANIATGYDADQAGETRFLVMEYVPGPTLADRLKSGPLPVAEACRAARHAALGLDCAHAAGLVHRDIKPSNLIQTPDGLVKVLDFGLVNFADNELELTDVHSLMGTLDYIAPEQARDAAAADARSDIYSLGCTLYHLLAGQPPFPGRTIANKIAMHLADRPPAIEGVPDELMAVILRMMAKVPAARFATAADTAAALTPYCQLSDEEGRIVARAARSGRVSNWKHALAGRGVLAAGAAIGFAALSGIAIYYGHMGRPSSGRPQLSESAKAAVPSLRREFPKEVHDHRVLRGHKKLIRRVVWSRNGQTLYSASDDGTCRAWNVGKLEETERFDHGTGAEVYSVSLTNNGRTLITLTPKRIRVWDIESGQEMPPFPEVEATAMPGRELDCTDVSPDGKLLATGSISGLVRIWDIAERKLLQDDWSPSPGHSTYFVCWYDNQRLLAAGRNSFCLRNIVTGNLEFKNDNYDHWAQVAAAPDGKTCAGIRFGGAVHVFDTATGRLTSEFPTADGRRTSAVRLSYAPDGRMVTAPRGPLVDLWDPATGTRLATFVGHVDEVYGLAVSRDGRWLATGGEDATVRIWPMPEQVTP